MRHTSGHPSNPGPHNKRGRRLLPGGAAEPNAFAVADRQQERNAATVLAPLPCTAQLRVRGRLGGGGEDDLKRQLPISEGGMRRRVRPSDRSLDRAEREGLHQAFGKLRTRSANTRCNFERWSTSQA